jgi:thiol:disulfide interchange protein DsbA
MNRRLMLKQLGALAFLSVGALPALAQLQTYTQLPNRIEGDNPGKIEVVEFFHYGCPHCRAFEPLVAEWNKKLPDDVVLRLVPTIWNGQLRELARLYYTIEATGHYQTLHSKVFTAVQDQRRPLHTPDGVRDWLGGFPEVDAAAFMDVYSSFSMNAKLQRAEQQARAYQIRGVPTMVVDGLYATSASLTGSHEATLLQVNELIERVRNAR